MITLTSVDHINATPEKVWHFLTHLHEGDSYLRWHPTDHKTFRLLRGDGESIGSAFNAAEMLGDKKFSFNYRLNRAEPQKYLGYGVSGLLGPLRFATCTFTLSPSGNQQTKLTARVHIGYRLPIIDWLVPLFVNTDAIQKHMAEEGYYLNKVLTTKEG